MVINMNRKTLLIIALISLICGVLLAGCGSSASKSTPTPSPSATPATSAVSESQKIADKMIELKYAGFSFGTGTYAKGAIPAGEYAFVALEDTGYYEEDDMSGSILDNQNFDSFGYVTVQGAGNVKVRGALVAVSALNRIGVSGAKDIYEKLYGVSGYNQAGMYKVGVDIPEGVHTVTSMSGQAYYEVMSGPVGNSEIVSNDNFTGSASVDLAAGQYIDIHRASIQ